MEKKREENRLWAISEFLWAKKINSWSGIICIYYSPDGIHTLATVEGKLYPKRGSTMTKLISFHDVSTHKRGSRPADHHNGHEGEGSGQRDSLDEQRSEVCLQTTQMNFNAISHLITDLQAISQECIFSLQFFHFSSPNLWAKQHLPQTPMSPHHFFLTALLRQPSTHFKV